MLRGFFLLISLIFFPFDQPKLVKTKATDKITVSIPQGWRPMDGIDFTERYPSVRAPLAAYSNEDRIVDFSINISATKWAIEDQEIASQFFKASLSNMFDRVDIINEGIAEIHGKKFIFFEFESRVSGSREKEGQREPILRYTYQQYYIHDLTTTVFTFSAPKRERETWAATAKLMMESIKIKK